jgi:multiple sugar transport system substrate-binding protein
VGAVVDEPQHHDESDGHGALPKMKQPAAILCRPTSTALWRQPRIPEEAWQWVRFLATPFYQAHFAKIGLWLPNQTAMLTEDGLAGWITEGIHPDNYSELVTDYLPQHGVSMRLPAGLTEAQANFLVPAFEAMANGEPVEETWVPAVQQANDILRAAQGM